MEENKSTEVKIKLNRGMKGQYGWELGVTQVNIPHDELKKTLKELDEWLKKTWIEGGIEEDGD